MGTFTRGKATHSGSRVHVDIVSIVSVYLPCLMIKHTLRNAIDTHATSEYG